MAHSDADAAALVAKVCNLPHNWIVETWRGWRQDRAGQIQILPTYPNFVAGNDIYPHAGPWPYLEDVPMLWYGPGYIRSQGTVSRPVTSADIAPTVADLLHFTFNAPDGRPMTEALVPAAQRKTPPRLIVTVVYDGGGMVVLDRWPKQHPNLDRLMRAGTYYDHATVGSNPTSTAQIHATIGTGAYPRLHGIVGNHMLMNGTVRAPWAAGPRDLLLPTLADRYAKAMGNTPRVGLVGSADFHLGMMSHGSFLPGGAKHFAVLHGGRNSVKWGLGGDNAPFYTFPSYVNSLPPLSTYFPIADASDGKRDGLWRGKVMSRVRNGWDTPARLPFQTNAAREVIKREGFGTGDVTDLFYLNYKLIDEVVHVWNMDSPEMHDTVKVQDDQLPQLIDTLNTEVGHGRWVMVLTADHGHTHDPRTNGAIRIDKTRVDGLLK
ncbi:MAG TPA: alkaline phosphatase family protein, partial [Actinomycetota bacterium]